MHVIGGLLLLVVAAGALFFMYTSGVLNPIFDPLNQGLSGLSPSSTVVSQYQGQVKIEFVSLGAGLGQPMVVSLIGANKSANPGITMTGWTLKTNIGTFTMPKTVNLYSPSTEDAPPEDIYLRKGGTINIYSGKNPSGSKQAIRSGLAEWQIWLGKNFLSAPHGTIILRDPDGRQVDKYEY